MRDRREDARGVRPARRGEDAFEALNHTHPGNPWAEGTTRLLRGAVEGDRGGIETGVEGLLERHRNRVDEADHRALHATVFAAEPTALTLLAWDRGLEYEPQSRFVPSSFLRETLSKLT
ncbi:MAG: Imm49 family immunity protein [Halolamina sp.]|uniref:Imm49 family immunity protein n=1 Tax=Halolamina sp. TaxID=1940283 RepID=UPI002FC2AC98